MVWKLRRSGCENNGRKQTVDKRDWGYCGIVGAGRYSKRIRSQGGSWRSFSVVERVVNV